MFSSYSNLLLDIFDIITAVFYYIVIYYQQTLLCVHSYSD